MYRDILETIQDREAVYKYGTLIGSHDDQPNSAIIGDLECPLLVMVVQTL